MPRQAPIPSCCENDRKALEQLARSRTEESGLGERATILLKCLEGERIHKIAQELRVRPHTGSQGRRRFAKAALNGLKDRARSGKPVTYGVHFRKDLLATWELSPPAGQARGDGPAVANHLNTSVNAVWRLLRQEGICLSRPRRWCVSTDPELIPNAADIVGRYLNPPENALVISVAENPSIQALARATG